jgi:hypothetical protein
MINISRFLLISLLFCAGFTPCIAQSSSSPQTFHSEIFKWTIDVPEGFERISEEVGEQLKSKGAAAIEDTYGEKVEDFATTLFMFRKGPFNYMEANYQPFDPADGTYDEQRKVVEQIIYETFRAQMPDVKIDTISSTQTIGQLNFYVFEIRAHLPNDMLMTMLMYSRLFDRQELSLNIVYVKPEEGELMLNVWRKSKFE